jgi:hypothetical protein
VSAQAAAAAPAIDRSLARDERRSAAERLAAAREALREALASKKRRIRELAAECVRERLAVRGAIFAMRQDALVALRAEIGAARRAARDARAARLAGIRRAGDTAIERTRAALAVALDHRAEESRIATHERQRRTALERLHKETLAGGALHGAKLEKLRPLLERARTLRPRPGESRVEALWRYAQAHPEEMHAILEPRAEKAVAKAQAAVAQAEAQTRAPKAHEAKRAARVKRMAVPSGAP